MPSVPSFGTHLGMKTILTWLHRRDKTLKWLAEQLGLSVHTVKKWPPVPAKHCRAIERLTGGEILAEDLRPDVFGQNKDLS